MNEDRIEFYRKHMTGQVEAQCEELLDEMVNSLTRALEDVRRYQDRVKTDSPTLADRVDMTNWAMNSFLQASSGIGVPSRFARMCEKFGAMRMMDDLAE